jgi:hypothetical protein
MTDYLALSDNTLSDEMRTYRQALRDITEGVTTLTKVKAVNFLQNHNYSCNLYCTALYSGNVTL